MQYNRIEGVRSTVHEPETWGAGSDLVEHYVAAWRRRLASDERARCDAAEVARASARQCASILIDRFGADRVYLFGSLTRHSAAPFGPHSDIDLAVEGLPVDRYWEALAAIAPELPPGTDVDLVPLESARPSLAEVIRTVGEVVAERS